MSKIGNQVIRIPQNIQFFIKNNDLILKGNCKIIRIKVPNMFVLGSQQNNLHINISFNISKKLKDQRHIKTLWGTFRSFINNQIIGLSQGFHISLKLIGVGYKMAIEDQHLNLKIGFSHPVIVDIPKNIKIAITNTNEMAIQSDHKDSLLQFAASVRSYKVPEPYKGKGIIYKGEFIRKKEGKKK